MSHTIRSPQEIFNHYYGFAKGCWRDSEKATKEMRGKQLPGGIPFRKVFVARLEWGRDDQAALEELRTLPRRMLNDLTASLPYHLADILRKEGRIRS